MQNQIFCIKLTLYFILSSILFLFLDLSQLHADAYGPLSKDRDLEVIKEKKWSVEGGLKFGILNANIRMQTGGPFSFFAYSWDSNFFLGDSFFPIQEKSTGDFSTPALNFSYKFLKSFCLDLGIHYGIALPSSVSNRNSIGTTLSKNLAYPLYNSIENAYANEIKRQVLPTLGFKYFFLDSNIKPFLSIHYGMANYLNSLNTRASRTPNLEFAILGGGLRYEISESTYWDTTLSYYDLKSSGRGWNGNKYNATGYGLDLMVGYKF